MAAKDPFLAQLTGRGVLAYPAGSGMHKLSCEITHTGDDYVRCEAAGTVYLIPVGQIASWTPKP